MIMQSKNPDIENQLIIKQMKYYSIQYIYNQLWNTSLYR